NAVLWILAAGLRVGFAGEIDYSALLVYLATVPLVLAASLLVALVYGAQERLLGGHRAHRLGPGVRARGPGAVVPRRAAARAIGWPCCSCDLCPARLDLGRRGARRRGECGNAAPAALPGGIRCVGDDGDHV